MNALFWNLVLALVWTLMTGSFSEMNFVVGFAVGAIILWATQSVAGMPQYGRRGLPLLSLAFFTLRELLLANFRVAIDVLKPTDRLQPGVIDVPLDASSDIEITLLAVLVTLTPGSTVIDITPDRRVMYVHSTNIRRGDLARERLELKGGFERRILEVTR